MSLKHKPFFEQLKARRDASALVPGPTKRFTWKDNVVAAQAPEPTNLHARVAPAPRTVDGTQAPVSTELPAIRARVDAARAEKKERK